jgi:DNA replication protein DnaC
MSDTPLQAVIRSQARTLRLPTVGREYESVARRASNDGWAYEDYLRELLEAEVRTRNENAARRLLRQARFPDTKTLDQIDWISCRESVALRSRNWLAAGLWRKSMMWL